MEKTTPDKNTIWMPVEEAILWDKLREEALTRIAEQWAKDFPWWYEKYTDESKERIQDSEQG